MDDCETLGTHKGAAGHILSTFQGGDARLFHEPSRVPE